MQREYMSRGKRVAIEEIDDVIGVKTDVEGDARTAVVRTMGERYLRAGVFFGSIGMGGLRARGVALRAGNGCRTQRDHGPHAGRRRAGGRQGLSTPEGSHLLGTNRLSVRLRNDLTDEQAREVLGRAELTIATRLKFAPQLYKVVVQPGRDFLEASLDLSAHPDFQFAEPQFIEHIPGRFTPTDPDYNDQWHLSNTGQGGGTAGADISAEEAWDMTRGAESAAGVDR